MSKEKHLSVYGIGPLYTCLIIILTVAGIIMSNLGLLDTGKIAVLNIPFIIIGVLLIIFGIVFWARANFESKIFKNIEHNNLVTSGVYAYVRNPIYTAISMICIGILLCEGNLWLLILPFIFWALMTILLKITEEKWLTELYGEEYIVYCKKVNRCIPALKAKR